MKPITTVILLFLCVKFTFSQSFVIDSAEWHYTVTYFNEPTIESNRFIFQGDTLINQIECKILRAELETCDLKSKDNLANQYKRILFSLLFAEGFLVLHFH